VSRLAELCAAPRAALDACARAPADAGADDATRTDAHEEEAIGERAERVNPRSFTANFSALTPT
jgi:hypothetical protein